MGLLISFLGVMEAEQLFECSLLSRWVDHRSNGLRQLTRDIWVVGPRGSPWDKREPDWDWQLQHSLLA